MKPNSSHSQPTSQRADGPQAPADEWLTSDPVWKLLDEASTPEPDAFFARNVVRATRQMGQDRPSLATRLAAFFSPPRLALGAAACACAALAWVMIPSTSTPPAGAGATAVQSPAEDTGADDPAAMSDLSELVMMETLTAAAEDPTIFTRDEVATMLGL